ncbi:hypothetical protein H1C71_026185, partial [Ictidomys tridecemlineatus]
SGCPSRPFELCAAPEALLRRDRLPSEVDTSPEGCEAGTRFPIDPSTFRSFRTAADGEGLRGGCGSRSSNEHVQPLPPPPYDSSTRRRPQYGVNNNAADSNPAASGRLRIEAGPLEDAFWELWFYYVGRNRRER